MVKKRTPPRKSPPKKRVKKVPRAARASASAKIDFNPVKEKLRAHIKKLEQQLGGPQARAAAVDPAAWETFDKLNQINTLMTEVCQPNMVIGS